MKKIKVTQKKVLWFHSRLEEELGLAFEIERIKPRLYQFTYRSNGICLGYTQLQVGIFLGEDIPFCESNGFFISHEVELVKQIMRYGYTLEFPHRDIAREEKNLREWKREDEKRLSEIKKKALMGGIKNVFAKRKQNTKSTQKVGKLHRRGSSKSTSTGNPTKCKPSKINNRSRVRKSSVKGRKRGSSKKHSQANLPVKKKRLKDNRC